MTRPVPKQGRGGLPAQPVPARGLRITPVQLRPRLLHATTRVCCRASEHPALQDGKPLCGERRCRLRRRVPPPEGSPGQLSRGRPPQVGSSTAAFTDSQHSALRKCRSAGRDRRAPQQKVGQPAPGACCLQVAATVRAGSCCSLGAPGQEPPQQQIWCLQAALHVR